MQKRLVFAIVILIGEYPEFTERMGADLNFSERRLKNMPTLKANKKGN